jgi:signal transduction histidine kinase
MTVNPIHLLNHQIIRDLPFGVVVVDKDLMIRDWNSWMDRNAGIPRAETQGQPLARIFPDLESKDLLSKIRQVFETGEEVRLSYQDCDQFFHFDSEHAPEQARTMIQETEIRPLFDAEAEVAMACIIVNDFTPHVQHLRELAAMNEELTKANQVKGDFLATTSHELRTPLTAILGFVDLLENDMAETPEEEKEYLCNIRNSASHLLNLINDILTAAKLQSKKLEVATERIEPFEILSETHAILHPVAVQKKVSFQLDLGEAELPMILADYQKLKQVLFNIVGNALKFTDQGTVVLKGYHDQAHSRFLTVEVIDTGIGIASEKMHLVFEQFSQADPSATRKYGGTGLGMPISKSLMELMKGTIEVESEGLGKGTTARIRIPLCDRI